MAGLSIFGIQGLPEIEPGTDLAASIYNAANETGTPLESGDILVITSKIVSKAEDRIVMLADVAVSPFAQQYAERWEKEPAIVELVLQESREVVRTRPDLIIAEHRLGIVLANAGIDRSNLAGDDVKQDAVAATSQLIGHAAKLANGLADGSDTPAETQEKVSALKDAIATYEAGAAAQLAACGV